MLGLPVIFFGKLTAGVSRVSRRQRLKRIESGTEGMLRNVGSPHRLTCGPGCKTSRLVTIFFRLASRCMSCQRGGAYLGHLKQARLDPGSAHFNSGAGPAIVGVRLRKEGKHSFSAIGSPNGH